MCRASAPGWRSGHRPGNRRADNCRGGANRPTVARSSAPERTPWGGRDRRVRTPAEAPAPEEGSFSAGDACPDDRMDGFTILCWERLTSAVNEGLAHPVTWDLGWVRGGFMVPMHAKTRNSAEELDSRSVHQVP